MLAHTGADALMIGRGAQGRPWIFREIRHFLDHGARLPAPTVAEARDIVDEHLADHYAFYGEDAGVRIARKHIGWYVQDLEGGGDCRREVNAADNARAQLAAVRLLFERLAANSERLDCRRRGADVVDARAAFATPQPQALLGRGGPCRVRKTLRINGGNEIGKTVEKSLDEYFRKLDGEPPHGIYDMVITHVERALIESVMVRANGNQTQAADMLGLNRNTLRTKLAKYGIR